MCFNTFGMVKRLVDGGLQARVVEDDGKLFWRDLYGHLFRD